MRCPYCQHTDTKVTDSRTTDEGNSIRRRRECINCGRRFTTYEIIEDSFNGNTAAFYFSTSVY